MAVVKSKEMMSPILILENTDENQKEYRADFDEKWIDVLHLMTHDEKVLVYNKIEYL